MSRISTTVWHQTVLGSEPTEEQLALYTCWPNFRGFSDRTQNQAFAEAAILLALRSGSGNDQVLILAPQAMEAWLLQLIEAVAIRCFEACPQHYPGRAKEMIDGFTRLFRKLQMTGRVLQLHQEPAHWVSFGFSADDTLPPWMQGRLLRME